MSVSCSMLSCSVLMHNTIQEEITDRCAKAEAKTFLLGHLSLLDKLAPSISKIGIVCSSRPFALRYAVVLASTSAIPYSHVRPTYTSVRDVVF